MSMKNKSSKKLSIIITLFLLSILLILLSISLGSVKFTLTETVDALFNDSDSPARLIIWNVRLPRILGAALVGICLSLSGCILQGVMRNDMASPSTIGVTSGASFIGYITLVVFPNLYYLLPVGSIIGAFLTTLLIYGIAFEKGVSPIKMILSGMAISAIFGAFNDMIKIFFNDMLLNATGFMVGSLNGVSWEDLRLILPYAIVGTVICFFLPSKMNILVLGDEMSNSLGLKTEKFRFFLIITASLLSGSAIAVAGLINFVGLIVPHIARQLVGSDYKYLFPGSIFLGVLLVVTADLIGRTILPVGEISASVLISFIGAPFFLYLLRKKKVKTHN